MSEEAEKILSETEIKLPKGSEKVGKIKGTKAIVEKKEPEGINWKGYWKGRKLEEYRKHPVAKAIDNGIGAILNKTVLKNHEKIQPGELEGDASVGGAILYSLPPLPLDHPLVVTCTAIFVLGCTISNKLGKPPGEGNVHKP